MTGLPVSCSISFLAFPAMLPPRFATFLFSSKPRGCFVFAISFVTAYASIFKISSKSFNVVIKLTSKLYKFIFSTISILYNYYLFIFLIVTRIKRVFKYTIINHFLNLLRQINFIYFFINSCA